MEKQAVDQAIKYFLKFVECCGLSRIEVLEIFEESIEEAIRETLEELRDESSE